MDMQLTQDERLLAQWLKICSPLYAVAGLAFVATHAVMFEWLRPITDLLHLDPTPNPTERFWLALSTSMMLMLTVCCALGARDIRRNIDMCIPVFMSKFCSTICGILFFAAAAPFGMYLLIATTDLPLGIVTFVLWRRARGAA